MLELLKQSPVSARIGMCMVLFIIILASLAPYITPYAETAIVGDVWEPFSSKFYLGTDHLGRDLLTRMIYGARNTVALAFITTMISFAFGTT